MNDLNLLIGNGETLVGDVKLTRGPSIKKYPYSIEDARSRLGPKLVSLGTGIHETPLEARPGGVGVAMFTVHPAFLAKTYLPDVSLRKAGLQTVGSRLNFVRPERDVRAKAGKGLLPAADLYVSGTELAFSRLREMLFDERLPKSNKDELRRIETLGILKPQGRIGYIADGEDWLSLEVALHVDQQEARVIESFAAWVRECDGEVLLEKKLSCRGVAFLPVRAPRSSLERLAEFSLLRVVRSLPALRAHTGRGGVSKLVSLPPLPFESPVSTELTAAIFDGGLMTGDFSPWVTEYVSPGLETTDDQHLAHGTAVTSAFLFGELEPGGTATSAPYTAVDHYRVIGPLDDTQWYALHDVLARIKAVLSKRTYDFVNLSLGPQVEFDDGHVDPWTSTIDELVADGKTLAVVAAGNVPDDDPLKVRVQPPGDAVNVITVGTANSSEFLWDRKSNSCIGPCRSPGLVKPDGLMYSGSEHKALLVHAGGGAAIPLDGYTSYGAPLLMRIGAGLRAVTDFPLQPIAPRALLIHHAERGEAHDWRYVGWGRFPSRIEDVLVSPQSSATIIYQGSIKPGTPQRARIPLPDDLIDGRVTIKATFCFTAEIDPAHPINYTRAGLIIVFRPRLLEKRTLPFFSNGSLYESEDDLRSDAHKWETVLKRTREFPALDLADPIFDIEYQTRERGLSMPKKNQRPLPYVLVVTVSIDRDVPLYNEVLQKYPTLNPVKLRQSVRLKS